MDHSTRQPPDWNRLFEIAAAQEGLFTTRQAANAGYSPQLLAHHVAARRITRIRRAVYRLVHFPAGEHEDLTAIWLWSDHEGVFSHHTALALHELSDVLPSRIHLTLPRDWTRRRLRVPDGVQLHFKDVSASERHWSGAVPVTTPLRTLADCAAEQLPPDLLRQATRDALDRGLIRHTELDTIERALEPFGGFHP